MYYSSLVRFPISSRFPVSFQSTPASFMTKADYKVHVERQTAIIALEKNKFSSVAWSCLTATPWITARQASLSITNSQSSLRLGSIELEMPSSHLILCRPLLTPAPESLPASESFPMSQLCMKWSKYWSFSFSIIPSKEHPGLIFRMDWLDLLAVQGTLKSLLQHHSSKASIL